MGAYLGHYRAGHADTVDELARVGVRGVSGVTYTLATYDQLQTSAALVPDIPLWANGDE